MISVLARGMKKQNCISRNPKFKPIQTSIAITAWFFRSKEVFGYEEQLEHHSSAHIENTFVVLVPKIFLAEAQTQVPTESQSISTTGGEDLCLGLSSPSHVGVEICPANSFKFCSLFNSLSNFISSNFFRSLNRSCCLSIQQPFIFFFFSFKVIMMVFATFSSITLTDRFLYFHSKPEKNLLNISSLKMRSGTRCFILQNSTCCAQKTQKMLGSRYSEYMGVNKIVMVLV